MKKYIIIPTIATMTLMSCGGGTTTQNTGTQSDTAANGRDGVHTVSTTTETTPTETSPAEDTGKGALPELVFDNLTYSKKVYAKDSDILPIIKTAKRVVIKGDKIIISDGKNEIPLQLDLASSEEEAWPDSYRWTFSTIATKDIPSFTFAIASEYEEACVARHEDPKTRFINLEATNLWTLSPKNFNSWGNLHRKMAAKYPSDEEYQREIDYINREEPDPSDFFDDEDDGGDVSANDGNIINDVVNDLVTFYDPYGMFEGEENISAERVAANRKDIKILSPTMAKFQATGPAETFSETFVCYKHKNGTWVVLDYFKDDTSPFCRMSAYEFKNGKLNWLSDFIPKDFLKGAYVEEFDANGFTIERDTPDGNTDEVYYKWNGEKFVE